MLIHKDFMGQNLSCWNSYHLHFVYFLDFLCQLLVFCRYLLILYFFKLSRSMQQLLKEFYFDRLSKLFWFVCFFITELLFANFHYYHEGVSRDQFFLSMLNLVSIPHLISLILSLFENHPIDDFNRGHYVHYLCHFFFFSMFHLVSKLNLNRFKEI